MLATTPTRTCLCLVLTWLFIAGGGSAHAVFPPAIKDDGKFFKADALEKANKKIKELYEKYKKDVVIETIASVPTDLEKKFKEQGAKKFFASHAVERVKTLGVNGIYILVCKTPGYLQIEMDSDTRKKEFTNSDRAKVNKSFRKSLGDEKPDEGLAETLDAIETALKANTKKK